ncbi:steroid delta-isomerase-like uncharacterized protein [Variovorax boronicumulans]|uniref:Steroid delta-isomerase-like uncharacterized protein n=1 Tax=Variovorax boronicumulans TaxID=436515 RepID=A0AAW8DU48_9BURK|nr:ester cyclase [Variovorax boronicumulans]MDP9877625.1 steroid delta-isomerase-like uncharacterized protein [Variovorax boronicumulans]MDP9922910.1 steroid delta-isomerase-like uncharacterized protein [Variovorax boronicumulans]
MKQLLSTLLLSAAGALANADTGSANAQVATRWYQAFDKREPALIEQIVDARWVDIPSPEGMPPGPEGLKQIYTMLTSTFPDLRIEIKDVIEQGDKVVVRSEISGTQKTAFLGMPTKNRPLRIQAIDIHEVKGGKIVRTWHTEDWMTGLHQLGILGSP